MLTHTAQEFETAVDIVKNYQCDMADVTLLIADFLSRTDTVVTKGGRDDIGGYIEA